MEKNKTYTLKDKCKALGPGILVVGSFIGPGTITSATRAGATYGYALLWTVIFSVIAVIVMQEMAARLGIVTQNGLAEELVKELSDRPPLKWAMIILVASAIVLGGVAYMGGDLTGTAIGISSLTGIPSNIVAPIWGIGVLILINIGDAVKTLEKLLSVCVSVMAIVFVVTMIIVKPDLGELLMGAVPNVPQNAIMTCVAMIGTTVVPYNMFIHATSARKTWHNPEELPLARYHIHDHRRYHYRCRYDYSRHSYARYDRFICRRYGCSAGTALRQLFQAISQYRLDLRRRFLGSCHTSRCFLRTCRTV